MSVGLATAMMTMIAATEMKRMSVMCVIMVWRRCLVRFYQTKASTAESETTALAATAQRQRQRRPNMCMHSRDCAADRSTHHPGCYINDGLTTPNSPAEPTYNANKTRATYNEQTSEATNRQRQRTSRNMQRKDSGLTTGNSPAEPTDTANKTRATYNEQTS
jgi:hypothetical protein